MQGLELAPERLHGVNQTDTRTLLKQGGVFPDDIEVIKRVMPIPYNMQMELAIYASNTDQMYQILEQILMLFDYDLQLQFNDKSFDWTKITSLELQSINTEENYPGGTERRVILWTLSFKMPIWLSPPLDVRKDVIQSISIRIGNLDTLTLDEIGDDGNITPFGETYTEFLMGVEGTNNLTTVDTELDDPVKNQPMTVQTAVGEVKTLS
jgi:hypothetical protein